MAPEIYGKLEEIALAPGDLTVWYTDGPTEASHQKAEEFGTKRLLESVRVHDGENARGICGQLWRDVAAFREKESLDDDLRLMVVKMKAVLEPNEFPPFGD